MRQQIIRSHINFFEGFSSYITEFTSLNLGVTLSDRLRGIVELPHGDRIVERPDEDFTHPSLTAVRYEIVVFWMSDIGFRVICDL
jgi:hypothetical protein